MIITIITMHIVIEIFILEEREITIKMKMNKLMNISLTLRISTKGNIL